MKTFKLSLIFIFVGLSGCVLNVAKDIVLGSIESRHFSIRCYPKPFTFYNSIYVLDMENDSLNVREKLQSELYIKGFKVLRKEEDKKEAEYFLSFSYKPIIGKYWIERVGYEPILTFSNFEAELFNAETKDTVATMTYSQNEVRSESIRTIICRFTKRLYKEHAPDYRAYHRRKFKNVSY